MTCLTQLARGCPTNGRTWTFHDVTHAMVTVRASGLWDFPAHNFHYWKILGGRWQYRATSDQR